MVTNSFGGFGVDTEAANDFVKLGKNNFVSLQSLSFRYSIQIILMHQPIPKSQDG